MIRLLLALIALVSTTAHATAADAPAADAAIKSPATPTPTSPSPSPAKSLPARVDLRPQMTEWGLAPRRQGRRNTCSVFTTTGVLEFAASKHNQKGTRLSVEYLNWACNEVINNHTQDRGQFFAELLKGFDAHGVCPEADMAYARRFEPELKPSPEAIESAQKIRELDLKVHWLKRWRNPPGLLEWRLGQIKEVLAAAIPSPPARATAGSSWATRMMPTNPAAASSTRKTPAAAASTPSRTNSP